MLQPSSFTRNRKGVLPQNDPQLFGLWQWPRHYLCPAFPYIFDPNIWKNTASEPHCYIVAMVITSPRMSRMSRWRRWGEKRTVRYLGWVRGGGIQSNHGTPQCHPSSKKSGLAKALLSDHGDKKSPWMNFVSKGFYVLEPENSPSWKRRNILQNTNFGGSIEIVLDKTNHHGNLRVTLLPMPY